MGELLTQTVRKDLDRRARTKTDTQLASGRSTVLFDAHAPHVTRAFPARSTEHIPLAVYSESLAADLSAALTASSVPHVRIPPIDGQATSIGLLESDWVTGISVLQRHFQTCGHTFFAIDSADNLRTPASLLTYATTIDTAQLATAKRILIFRPAAYYENEKVVCRYGFEAAISVNRWDINERNIAEATVWNRRTGQLTLEAFAGDDKALAPLNTPILTEPTMPIDVVYTWVDGTDPNWAKRKHEAIEAFTGHALTEDAAANLRFIDHDELRYSLRSIEQYAPWVRRIFIVTDRQTPEWLRTDHPQITIVDHSDIFPEATMLPTFNSHAIEACLHRIPGLSEHFLYFNDDVFLSSSVSPDLFFSSAGISSIFMSRAQVGVGEAYEGEIASDTAGKKARALIFEATGKRLSQKTFHAPFALRKSISESIERRWPEVVDFTRHSHFRRTEDTTVSGSLHINLALAEGKAVPHGIRYRYVNIGAQDAAMQLNRLFQDRHSLQTFCLNESDPVLPPDEIDKLVRAFLTKRFPDKSTFEK